MIASCCFAAAAGLLTFSDAICLRHHVKCCCEEYSAISAGNIHYPQHVGENDHHLTAEDGWKCQHAAVVRSVRNCAHIDCYVF